MTDAIDQVLVYVGAGLPVLPLHAWKNERCTCMVLDCHSPAKHPLTRHGKDDATTDLGVIAEWAARWPGCNWGIRPPVGVVILDVDVRSGGPGTLAGLQHRHGSLPTTLQARTGSGGSHIWLTYNGPTRGRLGQGIDVKTVSGYIVAPPSVHASGGVYQWTDTRPAAYAPQWVKNILNPPIRRRPVAPGHTTRGIDGLIRFVAGATAGVDRNHRLFWASCRAVEQGADPRGLVDAAVGVGLAPNEALATIRSAERTVGGSRGAHELLKGA